MVRQPYIYTLPEAFIEDKSVPMHWKLYTIVNGFWISGKTVFASNQFFAEKLGCTERHIQGCFEKLEAMGLLERVGKSQNRKIVPKGTNPEFVGGRTDSSVRDEPAVHHISDSNSEKNTVADAPDYFEIIEVQDLDAPSKTPKDDYVAEYRAMCDWSVKRRGFGFTFSTKQYAALKKARKLGIGPNKLKERWIELEREDWRDGFDWTSVVSSFDKRA